jgi:hypothetical protein
VVVAISLLTLEGFAGASGIERRGASIDGHRS